MEWCRWIFLSKVTENGKIFLFPFKIRERAKTTPRGGGVEGDFTQLTIIYFIFLGVCKLTWKTLGRVQ